jgi:DNA-binding MarR family transcriptional regulator
MNKDPEPLTDTDPPTDADLTAIITPLSALSTGMSRVIAGKPAVNRLALLQAVRYTPGIRPSRIAEALNLHQSQVTRQIQVLEDEGLLEVAGDPEDGRSRILTLTAAGEAEIDRLTAYGMTKWHRFVAGWDPAEVRELGRLLAKLHTSIIDDKNRNRRRQP